jgi:hypothetical protein
VLGLLSVAALLPGARAAAQDSTPPSAKPATAAVADSAKPLPPEQLEALVAPIALYPDPLLAQTLVASTYPLEIIQLQQWLVKNPGLKDKALADSVAKQPWDPSIQSMAAIPDVVKRLADDIQWTTDLGNAFLAQQAAVMEAVQRMRKKAADKGALVSNEQQKVDTQVVEKKTVIVVEPTNPEVIYVPTYSPTVVYGPPVYPYPPIYYPPYPPGAAMVSFTFGMMWGAAVWGGACCHAGWGGNNIYINNNNNFNQINHNRGGAGSGNWQHNGQHRGGAPYADARTANKYGGSTRGQTAGTRDVSGRQGQPSAGTRDVGGRQGQSGAGVSDRSAGAGQGDRGAGVSDRSAGAGQSQRAGVSDRSTGGSRGDQIGSRNVPSDRGTGSSGFSGGSRGYDGASARASSSRGSSSMGSRGGGGMSRGGGGGGRRR